MCIFISPLAMIDARWMNNVYSKCMSTNLCREENYLCQKCFLEHGSSQVYSKIDKPLRKSEPERGRQHPGGYDDAESSESKPELSFSEEGCSNFPAVPYRGVSLKDYTKIDKPLESSSSSSSSSATEGDIYITGHSLGAALALLIGKTLAAEENQRYHVHCFNPPFWTIVLLITEGIRLDKVRDKAKEVLGEYSLERLIKAAPHMMNLMKLTLAAIYYGEQLVEEIKHFKDLIDWVPVLYINKHDSICCKLPKHYKQKQKLNEGFEVRSQALISKVFGHEALFSPLVPSVDMRISKQPNKPHDLKNWYREPAIDKCRRYRLLSGVSYPT